MKYNKMVKEIHGIKVVHVKVPNLFTAYVGFHTMAGAFCETDENRGISHFLEHMMFKGTTNRSCEDIAYEGTFHGGIQNASTGMFNVSYYMSGFPKENFRPVMELLSDQMFNSTFNQSELDREKTVILEELKSYEDDHGSWFYDNLGRQLHCDQLKHNIGGYQDTVNEIQSDDIKAFYEDKYCQDNTVLLIIGDISKREVSKVCKELLKDNGLKKTTDHSPDTIDEIIVPEFGKEIIMPRAGVQQCYIAEQFLGGGFDTINVESSAFRQLFGGGMNSVLFKEIREKLGLCYSIGVQKWISAPKSSSILLSSAIDPNNLQQYRDAVDGVKADVAINGFSEKDFQAVKNSILGGFCRSIQDPNTLAGVILQNILFDCEFDLDDIHNRYKTLELDAVNEFAKTFLTDVESNIGIMMPE